MTSIFLDKKVAQQIVSVNMSAFNEINKIRKTYHLNILDLSNIPAGDE